LKFIEQQKNLDYKMKYIKYFENVLATSVNVGSIFKLNFGSSAVIMTSFLGEVIEIKNSFITFEVYFYKDNTSKKYTERNNYIPKFFDYPINEFISFCHYCTEKETMLVNRFRDAKKFGL